MEKPIIIVGAGLSGLRAASLLEEQGISYKVVEARDRIGGRVLSESVPNQENLGRYDLGPTWFWPQYEPMIASFVKDLNLETFVQQNDGDLLVERFQRKPPERCAMQENVHERGVRIKGGMQSLIDAVALKIPSSMIKLKTRIKKIYLDQAGEIVVEVVKEEGETEQLCAAQVILALPPRLIAKHIEFSPALPEDLMIDISEKPTWMGSQAKAVAVYDRPFWRESGLSGLVLSSAGPLQEIYDASPQEGAGALFGFFGINSEVRQQMGQEKITELVTNQLIKLFGSGAEKPQAILYKDWSSDAETAVNEDSSPFKNYGSYGQPPTSGIWHEKLLFAGTETNAQFSGHLEGALHSAETVVEKIISLRK
ncbi:amine oxidase [Planococcus sp. PAMC 21323]|uniref:flavin monoamine oxidase family protein n=1 Tax=Planococcus sp. PAMC 21323 TaxID=1526927 RepID=UPI000571F2FD|nr:FAD-dependent oxidoreductase [Planococcus sp. PAMC 21323]AIY05655.1 amine oxidase [Planococcus sp. PAMC 21323]